MITGILRALKRGFRSDLNYLKNKARKLHQIINRGYTDEDIYDLTDTTSRFILPRLERLAVNYKACIPYLSKKQEYMDEQKWRMKLDDMIYAFKNTQEGVRHHYNFIDKKRVKKGLKYFAKYYYSLGF